jgi:hypothetical protein
MFKLKRTLSQQLREDSTASPWICYEISVMEVYIAKLEATIERIKSAIEDEQGYYPTDSGASMLCNIKTALNGGVYSITSHGAQC